MKLLQVIKLSLIMMVTSASSFVHAQYIGGSNSGATLTLIEQANCNSIIAYPDIFKGGNEDGHSMVEISQANCGSVALPGIFKGGNEDGHSMVEITQANCGSVTLPNIFKGGGEDGHSMDEITQANCGSVTLPDIFKGGGEDGHSMDEITQANCTPVTLPDIYAGGIEDGHAMETIFVACAPNARFEADTTVICEGETLQFTDLSSGPPTSWSWTFNGATPSSSTAQNPSVVYNAPGTYSVTLSITSDGGNSAITKTSYITVKPSPSPLIAAVGSTTICDGDSVLLTSVDNYATYAWSNGDSTKNSYALTAGTHTLIATSANGCSAESNGIVVDVINNPLPVILATDTSNLCAGDLVTLTSSAASNYLWSPGGETTQSIDVTTSGTYWVTSTANGCSRMSIGITLKFGNVPSTPFITATGSLNICSGDSVLLTSQGADKYLWSPTGDTTQAIWVKTNSTHRVEVTNTAGCSAISDPTTVVVTPTPIANANINKPSVCVGDDVRISASTSVGANYNWDGPNGFISTDQVNNLTNVDVSDAGWYYLTVSSSGCSATDSVELEINATPIADANAVNTVICEGEDIALTANTVTADTYSWTGPNGFTSNAQNPIITEADVNASGIYTLEVAAGVCSTTSTVTITVNPTPIADANAVNATICVGEDIALTAATIAGGYVWTGPNGFTSTDQNPTLNNALANAGGYYVLETTAGVCSSKDSVLITVTPTPIADANATNTTICEGEDIALTAATIVGDYAWTGPNGFTSSVQNPTITEADINAGGIYTLEVTAGVCSTISTVTITVNPTPIADANTVNNTICVGEDIALTAVTVIGDYVWTGPNGFTSTDQNPTLTNTTLAAEGYYVLETTSGACSSKDSVQITVSPAPIADANAANTTICEGEDIVLTATTIVGDYAWSGPNGFTSTDQNPTLTEVLSSTSGYYVLEINLGTCSSKDSVEVTVNPTPIADANAANTTICEGENIELTANTIVGNYAWTGPNGFTSNDQNPTVTNTNTTAEGYYVLETINGACSSKDSVQITVNPTPIADANAANTTICEGEDIVLTATTIVGDYAWTGPNGFTSSAQNPTLTEVLPLTSGYYVLETILGTCSSKDSVEVTVHPAPIADANVANAIICAGENIVLSATTVTADTYIWNGPNGFTSTTQNPTINAASVSASGYYVLETTLGSCSTKDSVEVTVAPAPIANANAVNTEICIGEDIALTATTIIGDYSWTGPNGFTSIDQNPTIANIGVNANGYYVLEVTSGGCSSKDSVEISINALPVLAITSTDINCNGNTNGSATVVATGNAPFTYSWMPNGQTSATINNLSEGNYSVTVEDGKGCINTATVQIEEPAVLDLTTTVTNSRCDIDNGIAKVIATGGSGTYSYLWMPSGQTTASVIGLAPGSYTVLVTDANGCDEVETVVVNTIDGPDLAINTIQNVTCSGANNGSAEAVVTNGTAPFSYNWSPIGGTNATANNLPEGKYVVTVTDGSGCSIKDSVEITINTTLTVVANATQTEICQDENIELSTSPIVGADYAWTGPNGFTSADQNPTLANTGTNASGYYVLEMTSGGCSAKDSVQITVNALPTLAITGTDINCNGNENGSATVVATGNGPFFYSWSPNGETTASINNLMAGTYTVTVDDAKGCSNTESIQISEPAMLNLTTSVTETRCDIDNGIATVSATGGSGVYTYLWMPSGQTTASIIGLSAGSYTVLVTDANGCDKVETVIVNSIDGPDLAITNAQNVSCFGGTDGSAEVTASNGTLPYTYSWSPIGGTNAIANNLPAGNYVVTVTDNSGCSTVESVTITEPDELDITSTIKPADCGEENGNISLAVTGGTSPYTFDWLTNTGTGASIQNISGGDYSVTVTDGAGCEISTTYTVPSNGALSIQVLPEEATILKGEEIALSVNVDPGIVNETYNWTPATGLSCTNCPNPIASPSVTTTYYVEVTTPDNCSGIDSTLIIVNDVCSDIYIPNIFSPNGDGKNDEYCIYGECISTFSLQIFNRWGELVYISDNEENCWDGTYKGKKLNTDVFVYKVSITTLQGEEIEESGNINLVR